MLIACLQLAIPALAMAWSGHQVTEGDLTVLIEEVTEVRQLDRPFPVKVALSNRGTEDLRGTLEVRDLVDATRVVGPAVKAFTVPGEGTAEVEFTLTFGPGTYSALYPVHVYATFASGGQELTAHAVRIITVALGPADDESSMVPTLMTATQVPVRGALPLWTLGNQRVAWQYLGQPTRYKPAGWAGSDAECRASMYVTHAARGESKPAVSMHPPWVPGAGTIWCDYLLTLPDTRPLKLTFATAIRDHFPPEPPSDGVLFRVWVAEGPQAAHPEPIFSRFSASKRWEPGEVDLSAYAGQTILLRLESHPGPQQDTTCDQSFWGEPVVIAGEPPAPSPRSFQEIAAEHVDLGRRILAGTLQPDGEWTFVLGSGGHRVVAVLSAGQHGLLDGVLSLVGPRSAVSFNGLRVDIVGQPAGRWPTAIQFDGFSSHRQDGRAVFVHRLTRDGRPLDLTLSVWAEGDGLRVAWSCPERITDFCLGPASQEAPVVYYGHGYRIVNPGSFRTYPGGHDMATSHMGCEFADGMSLLQAVDVPPDTFEVNPEARVYSLHAHMNGTLTLVAGEQGAFDCAIRYRPLFPRQPAGGVARLAGRFCFDIWGGRYADIARQMAEAIRYGLTDSLLTVHAWQRWGYDYRLPDIWPPEPGLGTVDDMRQIGEVCRAHDIPWGLHDNYIDFYPDATGFSYDHICFTPDGQPIRAWYNAGRDAQSYRWRPDRIMPFVQRNLHLIKEGVAPTHYFIDVFTSIGCFDYYDREGVFHPMTETQQKWGEVFAWIRDFLGDNAPTTSEAGHDQLIGWLDGADCQHMPLGVPCESWEKVPWFDAVNHHRFILHGVGYSDRYQGGRSRRDHGINSDDYLSMEVLGGHALMTDAPSWGLAAVRKYWLAQGVARNLALRQMIRHEMAGGDVGRQIVTWDNGTRVYVNRGEQDWAVEDRLLPQYGYLVVGEGIMSTIETRQGVICESSSEPGVWYCNARTVDPEGGVQIEPRVESFRYLGGNRFTWDVVWDTGEPAPRDMTVFVHFCSDRSRRQDKIVFQDDHQPPTPTSRWAGQVHYPRTLTVPQDAEGQYLVLFGLYDEGGRLAIRGPAGALPSDNAIWVGTLTVRREGDRIADISFTPSPRPEPTGFARLNLARQPVDFGFAVTDGGFRVQTVPGGLRLIPLPGSPPFTATLRLARIGLAGAKCQAVVGETSPGVTEVASFDQRGDELTIRHEGRRFWAYDLRF